MDQLPPTSQNIIGDSPDIQNLQENQEQPESQQGTERKFTPSELASDILSQFGKNYCFEESFTQNSQQAKLRLQYLASTLRKNTTFNMLNGQLGHTNSVLLNTSNNQDIQLFLPGYMRMRVRNLVQVDVGSGQTQVNATISFSIHYGKLPRLLVDYLKQSLVLRFSKKNCVLLKQTQQQNLSIKVIEEDGLQLITFFVDLPLTFHFQPYYPIECWRVDMSIWFSPFQKIENLLTITVQDLVVRFDDMLVEFNDVYNKEEFQQVQDYFKHLKNYNGEIRKLIVRINLMNLVEPNLVLPKPTLTKSEQIKQFISSKQSKNVLSEALNINSKYSISSLIRQKYRQMIRIVNGLSEQKLLNQNLPPQDKTTNNDIRMYHLEQDLMKMLKYGSPIRFSYEQQHLLGSYEIVAAEMRVRFSCYKYFVEKERQKARNKLYDTINYSNNASAKVKGVAIQNHKNEQLKMLMAENKGRLKDSLPNMQEIIEQMDISLINIQRNQQNERQNSQTSAINIYDPQKMIQQIVEGIRSVQQGPKAYQFAHYELSIYKHPFVSLAIVFFPLWIIAVVNLNIYFSPMDLNDRIANVATLLISYVAYIPIFRQQVPQYRYLLLSEIFAFLQIFCSFLTLVHSLIGQDSDKKISIQEVGPIFWISFSITVFTFMSVVIAYIVFKCAIQPRYKRKKNTKLPSQALRHILWNNFECDFAYLKKDHIKLFEQCVSFKEFNDAKSSRNSNRAINPLARIQSIQCP